MLSSASPRIGQVSLPTLVALGVLGLTLTLAQLGRGASLGEACLYGFGPCALIALTLLLLRTIERFLSAIWSFRMPMELSCFLMLVAMLIVAWGVNALLALFLSNAGSTAPTVTHVLITWGPLAFTGVCAFLAAGSLLVLAIT